MPDALKNNIFDSELYVEGDLRIGDENHITYKYESISNRVYFEEVDLTSSSFKKYLPPVFLSILLERLERNRILFLGGAYNFNKDGLMKFLSSKLISNEKVVVVKESIGIPSLSSMLATLRKAENHTVYIISKATPELFEYNFEELKKVTVAEKHFVLISTDSPRELWHLTEIRSSEMWYEINAHDAYSQDFLSEKLAQSLDERNIKLPPYFDLPKLSNQLNSPENIELFIEILSTQNAVTPESIETCLNYAAPDDALGVTQWFQNLTNDHKLLAIGFALFSGLQELQFFDVMDMLIQEGWKGRNHQLKPLDYNDILPLLSYFKIESGYIRSKYPKQDAKLLIVAWKTHRRFLDAAFPILAKLAIQSSSKVSTNWRLFGTRWRQNLVRQVIKKALIQLGEIDFTSIENTLLSIGSCEDFEVRMVSAEILANLRPILNDTWYKIISRWQTNLEIQNLVSSFLESEQNKEPGKWSSLNYIQATIAATLGAVVQTDAPNKLDERILEQIKKLARIRNELVTRSVQHALRFISARHTEQVSLDFGHMEG
jgi:hypothetical protein